MYTTHGHYIQGTPRDQPPDRVVSCGGPTKCRKCYFEIASANVLESRTIEQFIFEALIRWCPVCGDGLVDSAMLAPPHVLNYGIVLPEFKVPSKICPGGHFQVIAGLSETMPDPIFTIDESLYDFVSRKKEAIDVPNYT
jgi:hypothetical protein